MSSKEILLITIHAARMPGIGGEVRAHYFIQAAAELGNVTLVSLCGAQPDHQVPQSLATICQQVIQPSSPAQPMVKSVVSKSRLAAWRRTLLTVFCPWRNQWQDFLRFCVQYCNPPKTVSGQQSERSGRRLLTAVLRLEYRLLAERFRLPPYACAAYGANFDQLWPAIQECLRQKAFDTVWVEDVFAYPFAEKILSQLDVPSVSVICNSYNIETYVFERTAAADSVQARRHWELQSHVTRSMEKRAYGRSDLVFTCSEQDSQLGRTLVPEGNFRVVANGVNVDYFRPDRSVSRADRPTLLFTGGFGYGPNREALKYFVRQILPLIKTQRDDLRFVFAGAQASAAWRDHGLRDLTVECVSDPADIRPCFQQAWVFVVPLLVGGGTRLKILEAMAMEVPVVSTSVGAEGLDCIDGLHLLLADSPQAFADAVIRLLNDQELSQRMKQSAGEWVRNRYSWKSLSPMIVQKVGELDAG